MAEDEHQDEAQQPIEASSEGQPRRIVGRRVDQLEPGEGEEQDDGRPAAEPCGQALMLRFGIAPAE